MVSVEVVKGKFKCWIHVHHFDCVHSPTRISNWYCVKPIFWTKYFPSSKPLWISWWKINLTSTGETTPAGPVGPRPHHYFYNIHLGPYVSSLDPFLFWRFWRKGTLWKVILKKGPLWKVILKKRVPFECQFWRKRDFWEGNSEEKGPFEKEVWRKRAPWRKKMGPTYPWPHHLKNVSSPLI